jgi:hypothetical protein
MKRETVGEWLVMIGRRSDRASDRIFASTVFPSEQKRSRNKCFDFVGNRCCIKRWGFIKLLNGIPNTLEGILQNKIKAEWSLDILQNAMCERLIVQNGVDQAPKVL